MGESNFLSLGWVSLALQIIYLFLLGTQFHVLCHSCTKRVHCPEVTGDRLAGGSLFTQGQGLEQTGVLGFVDPVVPDYQP